VQFHFIGLKCIHCGSYNTCQDSQPTDVEAAAEPSSITQAQGDDDHGSDSATVPDNGTGDGDDKNVE